MEMKVTINGSVRKDALKSILESQSEKIKTIEEFCKEQKISQFYYKDSELEYEFNKTSKQKVEVRKNG
jgi:hypothetical protein